MTQAGDVVWRDGQLRDVTDDDERVRVALATLPCPLAYSDRSDFGVRVAVEELAHTSTELGHAFGTPAELATLVQAAVARVDADVAAIAVVPKSLPSSAVDSWKAVDVVSWQVAPYSGDLRSAVFEPPFNDRGAAASLRVTGDAEHGASQRWARSVGVDMALRLNLSGSACRAGSWSIVVALEGGELLTPGVAAGGPYDGWTRELVRRGVLGEGSLGAASLQTAEIACVTGWGRCHAVRLSSDSRASDLAARLNEHLQAIRDQRP